MDAVLSHKEIARLLREAYTKQIKSVDFLRGKLLIEADFKQKITIGLSPRQMNNEYYNKQNRTCLGKLL